MVRVTRADGRPAFENARPRLRQSHFTAARRMHQRYSELAAEAREPVDFSDDPTNSVSFLTDRQSSIGPGLAMAIAVLVAWSAFFLFLP